MWWTDENSYYHKLNFSSKLFFVCKAMVYVVLAEGIYQSDIFEPDQNLVSPYFKMKYVLTFFGILVFFLMLYVVYANTLSYVTRRTLGNLITVSILLTIGTILKEDTNFIRYLISAYYLIGALCMIGLLFGAAKFVKYFYLVHDLIVGHIMFFFIFLLAAMQFVSVMQTWGLYHNALSSDVVANDILRHARKNQQSAGDDSEQITELKKIVRKQAETLQKIIQTGGTEGAESLSMTRNASTDAIASLIAPSSSKVTIQQPKDEGIGGRVMSMSGLDVWTDMALGVGEGSGLSRTAAVPVPTSHAPTRISEEFRFAQPDAMPPR